MQDPYPKRLEHDPEQVSAAHIPVTEETVRIHKQARETGSVRVRTIVEDEPVELHEMLARETAEVERVPVGRVVETAPKPRQEGDTLVIPVIEERLLVRKELVLVEELRIRLARSEEPVSASTTRRVMHAVVEREETASPTKPGTDEPSSTSAIVE